MTHSDKPTPLKSRASGPLTGKVRVPGDKSISHRALILGALAVGETRITGLLEGEDVLNTAKSMQALGAKVERTGDFAWKVQGVGVGGFAQPKAALDFGNSGTGCRLVMGAVAGCPISAIFDGDASLRSRPMRRILDPLEKMGAKVASAAEGGRLPLTVQGARDPLPITYKTPVASAQIKSAVLLAGLSAPGTTTVIESEASRDHTELMLKHFGADITSVAEGAHGRRITLVGQPELHGADRHRARRSVLSGVSDRRCADRRRLRCCPVRRDDQSAAHRPFHDAARNGRLDRGKRSARRRRRADGAACACAPQNCAASKCRRSARPR